MGHFNKLIYAIYLMQNIFNVILSLCKIFFNNLPVELELPSFRI